MSINLRDKLLAALLHLPGTREFHLHVLVSSPRKNFTLFPFARPRPKAYLQDILILLSEQTTPDSPRILVTAIEACVYNIPATSCAVFYVSKVDTTGQSTAPSPTATLVRALLTFYADPTTRPLAAEHVWIHLFARAQNQYLFPNSSEYAGKRPLSDVKLCAWWKRVLTEVAGDLNSRPELKGSNRLYYVLPGYSEVEAANAMRLASSSAIPAPMTSSWVYGHPYSQTDVPLPCPPENVAEGSRNLGHFIPSFDDDPKSRFMEEIAYTTDGDGVKSPARKRSRTSSQSDVAGSTIKASEENKNQAEKDERPLGELNKVSADDFWERMSFRQECVAGAVTGFFTLIASSAAVKDDVSGSMISALAPQPGQVPSQINKRIMTTLCTGVEFSTIERSIRSTETLESAIKGLCAGIAPIPTPTARGPRDLGKARDSGRRSPEADSHPQPGLVAPPRQMVDDSANPFGEPEASLETYRMHIYGTVRVRNAERMGDRKTGEGEKPVTVLTVRRKKKRSV